MSMKNFCKGKWFVYISFIIVSILLIMTIDFDREIKYKYRAIAVIEDVQLHLDAHGPSTKSLILNVEGKDQNIQIQLPNHALIFKDKKVLIECIEFIKGDESCMFLSYTASQ